MYTDACESSQFLSVILLIKKVIGVIKIVGPIILIIMASLDIAKYMINVDDKLKKKIVNRFAMAALIFLVPSIVQLCMSVVDETDIFKTSCWLNANNETIATIKEAEDAYAKKVQDALDKKLKEKEKEEYISSSTTTQVVSGTPCGTAGYDGCVRSTIDAKGSRTYYYPKEEFNVNRKDLSCQEAERVANLHASMPFLNARTGSKGSGTEGLNIDFSNQLSSFITAANMYGGGTISIGSGWRAYDTQKAWYIDYRCGRKKEITAFPGFSDHGWGLAADLKYSNEAVKIWAHRSAAGYDLEYTVCDNFFTYITNSKGQRVRDCKEDWHISPAHMVTYKIGG